MRRFLYILSALALLAVSCSKQPPLSDSPIFIEVTNLQPQSVWFDIIPETNDFYYYFDVVAVSEYEKYPNVAAFIKEQDDFLRETYDIIRSIGEVRSFQETCLYRDAIFEPYYGNGVLLEPEHDYYVFAYPYDNEGRPIEKLVKVPFTTPPAVHSDITFEISLFGSTVSIVPSNGDQYLFDYDTVEDVELSYAGLPSYFFYEMINVYEEYGFMPSMLSIGEWSEDMQDYITIKPGDKVYFGIAGYDNGLTSEISFYTLTYNGPGLPGLVEPYNILDIDPDQDAISEYISMRGLAPGR